MILNSKIRTSLKQLCKKQAFRMDAKTDHLFGIKNGYHVAVRTDKLEKQNTLFLCFSAVTDNGPVDEAALKQLVAAHKEIAGCAVRQYSIAFLVSAKNPIFCVNYVNTVLDVAAGILAQIGARDCCQQCGTVTATATASVNGSPIHFCQCCYNQQVANTPPGLPREKKAENKLGGVIGAFVGALIGVAAIVLFAQLNLVSYLSGLAMAFFTLWMYEKMAGSISKFGIVLCVLVMGIMVYMGDRVDWAIIAVRDLEVDFFTGFRIIPNLLKEGMIESGAYAGSLALLYLFTAGGAIPMIVNAFRRKKSEELEDEILRTPVFLMHE